MIESSRPNREQVTERLSQLITSEHWMGNFVSDLVSAYELGGGIDFPTAEQLLATAKDEFNKELALARRMYRLYPDLVVREAEGRQVSAPEG